MSEMHTIMMKGVTHYSLIVDICEPSLMQKVQWIEEHSTASSSMQYCWLCLLKILDKDSRSIGCVLFLNLIHVIESAWLI